MDSISPPVQAVLDLFADSLRDVRFGEIDAASLAELAKNAAAAAEVVAATEAQLQRERRVLQERQDALLAQAQRALAYARVYAESDPALTDRLDQIALPRPPKRPRLGADALVLEVDGPPRSQPAADELAPPRRRRAQRKEREDVPMLLPESAAG